MELYFAEGADLTDPKVLIKAAADCGMDSDLVRRLLASEADVDRIESEANSAKEAGIDGVPCFIFGGSVIVTGAQSPEYLANAIARIVRALSTGIRFSEHRAATPYVRLPLRSLCKVACGRMLFAGIDRPAAEKHQLLVAAPAD